MISRFKAPINEENLTLDMFHQSLPHSNLREVGLKFGSLVMCQQYNSLFRHLAPENLLGAWLVHSSEHKNAKESLVFRQDYTKRTSKKAFPDILTQLLIDFIYFPLHLQQLKAKR